MFNYINNTSKKGAISEDITTVEIEQFHQLISNSIRRSSVLLRLPK